MIGVVNAVVVAVEAESAFRFPANSSSATYRPVRIRQRIRRAISMGTRRWLCVNVFIVIGRNQTRES